MTKVLALLLILFAATPTAGITENNTQQLTADEINENFKRIRTAGSYYNYSVILSGFSSVCLILAASSDEQQAVYLTSAAIFSITGFVVSLLGNSSLSEVSYKRRETKPIQRDYSPGFSPEWRDFY